MRFSLDLDKEIFKFFSYFLIILVITFTIGIVSIYFFENELGKLKVQSKNRPYLNQITKSIEI